MPRTLKQLAGAKRGVKKAGGQKIDFKPIAQAIIKSGNYYTVSEVWKNLVHKKVGRYRTMRLLNAQCVKGKMERLLEKGVFYYGPKIES